MAWVRLDDRFHGNRKVRRAWRNSRASVGLFTLSLTYCAQHETDGRIDLEWVEDTLPSPKDRNKAIAALLDAGLWVVHADGYEVHDYLDYNESRAALTERRTREAERKRRGRETQQSRASSRSPRGQDADSAGTPQDASVLSLPESDGPGPAHPQPDPDPAPEEVVPTSVEPARLDRAHIIRQLFAYWQLRCEHPRAQLTPERRKAINARLDQNYTVEDIRRGIDGAAANPPRSDDMTVTYDDLVSICRNGAQLERYVARAGSVPPPAGEGGFLDRLNGATR